MSFVSYSRTSDAAAAAPFWPFHRKFEDTLRCYRATTMYRDLKVH
jgi:hypothetical protein